MSEAVVLIDFANFVPEADELVAQARGLDLIDRVISFLLDEDPATERIEIRLYGGWMDAGVLTPLASAILSAPDLDPFPITNPATGAIVRGAVELVRSLALMPAVAWPDLVIRESGIARLRQTSILVDACVSDTREACPLRTMHWMSRRYDRECPMPTCTMTFGAAFENKTQKMVDSLLVCDLIHYGRALGEGDMLLLLSDDLDLLPGLLVAAESSGPAIHRVRPGWSRQDRCRDILDRHGVREGHVEWNEPR
jgi:hypothetical protein